MMMFLLHRTWSETNCRGGMLDMKRVEAVAREIKLIAPDVEVVVLAVRVAGQEKSIDGFGPGQWTLQRATCSWTLQPRLLPL